MTNLFIELKKSKKEELKALAKEIKLGRPLRKPHVYQAADTTKEARNANYNLERNSLTFRHMHIAYCQFFNRTPYALIETPRENNKPIKHKINSYMTEWKTTLDKLVEDEEAAPDAAAEAGLEAIAA